jgi:dienelactone hydrolase
MSIDQFQQFTHSTEKITHPVFYAGEGPAIIIIHELPGMVKECIHFAERLIGEGFSVYMPLLFGQPGKMSMAGNLARLCVSWEFNLFAKRKTSPVVDWLRSLCRHIHSEKGGKGVGAIGMCLTGGFAIPMMVEPSLMAPVLSQPSLPLAMGKATLGTSDQDLKTAKERATSENITIKAYRFSRDPFASAERMATYKSFFGEHFDYKELDSSQQKKHKKGCHSVFTLDFVNEPGHPTHDAYIDLVSYFKQQLC